MPSVDVVFMPDLHIGAFNSVFPDLDNPDMLIYEAANQVANYARENGIKHIIFLGDLFDNAEPTQRQIGDFLSFLFSLEDFEVHIITGNHDYEHISHNSLEVLNFLVKAELLPHVNLYLQPTDVDIEGVPFSFLPWPYYNKKKLGLNDKPSINIAHVEQAGSIRDGGTVTKEGVKLNTKKDHWVIGHLHRMQQQGNVIYPGTLFQRTFGEPLPKGFLHSTLRSGSKGIKVKHKWRAIQPPFEMHNIRVETPDDLLKVEPYNITNRPIYRYKLFIRNGVALSPNYRHDNPHVVKIDGWKTKEEAKALEQGSLLLNPNTLMETKKLIFFDLNSVLRKHKLKKTQRRRARHVVAKIASELGLIEESV